MKYYLVSMDNYFGANEPKMKAYEASCDAEAIIKAVNPGADWKKVLEESKEAFEASELDFISFYLGQKGDGCDTIHIFKQHDDGEITLLY